MHVEYSGTFEEDGVERGTIHGVSDVSATKHRLHNVSRTEVTALSSKAVDYTAVGEVFAVKHVQAVRGEQGEGLPESWSCEPVPGDLSKSYFLVYEWRHLIKERNVGATVVDGQVW